MDRRTFLAGTGAVLLAAPLVAGAQQAPKVPRVGSLSTGPRTAAAASVLSESLVALGYVEGKTIIVERRYAEGRVDRLPALAGELVQLNADVIVAWGVEPLEAVRKTTSRIPIVMVGGTDPVATGLAASLSRPGGQVTGVTFGGPELAGKRLELLREALPGLSRVVLLRDPSSLPASVRQTESAARALNLHLDVFTVNAAADLKGAFKSAVKGRAGAMQLLESSMLTAQRAKIAELAIRNRVPVIGHLKQSAEAGLLMSYGVDLPHVTQRVAALVDKILKGARPGDLPFEQPTKFELVINLKTAKALGLTIPPSLLQRADEVIQ
jgi:putative ABC transport system substrate-binding protein